LRGGDAGGAGAGALGSLAGSGARARSGPAAQQQAISASKTLVGRYGRQFGEQAVQLFGGMGMTEEFGAARLFKRLLAIDLTWGNAGHHVERYAALARAGR
jgi:alkylation response protein AidB-like acyl-CoA dehydrogenase